VLYFSLVAPAICYLFFLHDVLYVFLANKWWGWWWYSEPGGPTHYWRLPRGIRVSKRRHCCWCRRL